MNTDRLAIDCRVEVHQRGSVERVVPWLLGAVAVLYCATTVVSGPPWPIFSFAIGLALTAVIARMVGGGTAARGTVECRADRLVILRGPVRLELPAALVEEWAWVRAPDQRFTIRTAAGVVVVLHITADQASLLTCALDAAKAGQCKRHLLSSAMLPISPRALRTAVVVGPIVIGVAVGIGGVIWPGSNVELFLGVSLSLAFAASLALGQAAQLIVGCDGIAIEGRGFRSHVPFAEIRSVHSIAGGAAVRLCCVHQDYLVPISPNHGGPASYAARLSGDVFSRADVLQARREAIVQSIHGALLGYRRLADPPDPSPPPSFTTKQTAGGSPYRLHPTLRPALVEVLCSPRSRTGARLGAALALAPLDPSEVPVVMKASEGFANRALRAAIAKAVTGAPARKDMAKALHPEKWLAAGAGNTHARAGAALPRE